MADLPPGVDREVFDDLVCVEESRDLFGKLGREPEIWELLCLVKEDRKLVRDEVQRLKGLVQAGRAAGIGRTILDKLGATRERMGMMAQELAGFIPLVPGTPLDQELVQFMVAFIMVSPKGREAASRWVADPARSLAEATTKLKAIQGVVVGYHKVLRAMRPARRLASPPPPAAEAPMEELVFEAVAVPEEAPAPPPAPAAPPEEVFVPIPAPPPPVPAPPPAAAKTVELPPGVDLEVLDDVRRVQQCRRIFEETHQQIEVWEVFMLVMQDREAIKKSLEDIIKLKEQGQADQFTEGALTLFEKLLDIRAKHGRFVRQAREYIGKLPIGHFGKDTMDLAVGFIVASAKGREAAQRWVDAPQKFLAEASGRLEDIISRTMKYEAALRMVS